jgi:5-enolpyruvylshikimate-3-phosphate synthase
VAGLAAHDPVIVTGGEIVGESFPGFADALRSIGARIETE